MPGSTLYQPSPASRRLGPESSSGVLVLDTFGWNLSIEPTDKREKTGFQNISTPLGLSCSIVWSSLTCCAAPAILWRRRLGPIPLRSHAEPGREYHFPCRADLPDPVHEKAIPRGLFNGNRPNELRLKDLSLRPQRPEAAASLLPHSRIT